MLNLISASCREVFYLNYVLDKRRYSPIPRINEIFFETKTNVFSELKNKFLKNVASIACLAMKLTNWIDNKDTTKIIE